MISVSVIVTPKLSLKGAIRYIKKFVTPHSLIMVKVIIKLHLLLLQLMLVLLLI